MSERYRIPQIAAATVLALGACAAPGTGGQESSAPAVKAKIANPDGAGLEVNLLDGGHVNLANGTAVAALCLDSGIFFTFRTAINSGPYANSTATHVPRADLENTNDPFQAGKQNPPADPFEPLPPC